MKVVGCYSVYNDADMLQPSITSLAPFVDEIVVVDGAYWGFPADSVVSTDRLLEVLEPFEDKVKLLVCEETTPIKEKMSRFFEAEADWYVHLDADEIVIGDKAEFRKKLKSKEVSLYHVQMFDFKTRFMPPRILTTRIFKSLPDIKYHRQHWEIWQVLEDMAIRMVYPNTKAKPMPIHAFSLVHLHGFRSRERLEKKRAYVEWRNLIGEG